MHAELTLTPPVDLAWADVPGWLLVAVVAIGGTARLVRLLVFDDYPPVVWLRTRWDHITGDGGWSKLVHCGFCAAPWLTIITAAWALLSDFHWTWWVFYGWLTVSYLASSWTAYDESATG